jgi:hypothetical protein
MDYWAQREGERDTSMVFYDPSSRFEAVCAHNAPEAYQTSDYNHTAYWKIGIRPVPWADLERKRVGLIFWRGEDSEGETLLANYGSTLPGGIEQWQAQTDFGYAYHPLTFVVWYQDGLGHTYYDDNNGMLYEAKWQHRG